MPDSPVLAFADVMRLLRERCAWKAAQTHASLARYLLEEAHETIEALDLGDPVHLREELGDLLLQVFLHTAIAEQAGDFSLDDVAREVTAKMVRRNPHVFAADGTPLEVTGPQGGDADSVDETWQQVKASEKPARTSVLDGIAPTLPALLRADKVLERLAREHGPAAVALGDAAAGDLGEELLALVARGRAEGIDPEQALRGAVRRLVERVEGSWPGRPTPRGPADDPRT